MERSEREDDPSAQKALVRYAAPRLRPTQGQPLLWLFLAAFCAAVGVIVKLELSLEHVMFVLPAGVALVYVTAFLRYLLPPRGRDVLLLGAVDGGACVVGRTHDGVPKAVLDGAPLALRPLPALGAAWCHVPLDRAPRRMALEWVTSAKTWRGRLLSSSAGVSRVCPNCRCAWPEDIAACPGCHLTRVAPGALPAPITLAPYAPQFRVDRISIACPACDGPCVRAQSGETAYDVCEACQAVWAHPNTSAPRADTPPMRVPYLGPRAAQSWPVPEGVPPAHFVDPLGLVGATNVSGRLQITAFHGQVCELRLSWPGQRAVRAVTLYSAAFLGGTAVRFGLPMALPFGPVSTRSIRVMIEPPPWLPTGQWMLHVAFEPEGARGAPCGMSFLVHDIVERTTRPPLQSAPERAPSRPRTTGRKCVRCGGRWMRDSDAPAWSDADDPGHCTVCETVYWPHHQFAPVATRARVDASCPKDTRGAQFPCPNCKTACVTRTLAGHDAAQCPGCGGVVMTEGAAAALVARAERGAAGEREDA